MKLIKIKKKTLFKFKSVNQAKGFETDPTLTSITVTNTGLSING